MAKVLVVGGAGYVGSGTCAYLLDQGHQVWVLDNLSTGHRELVLNESLTVGDAGNTTLVADLVQKQGFDCVMHFAAKSIVPESILKPDEYYQNNVVQTRTLLETLVKEGVKNFIFSSTAALFGDPGLKKITEKFEIKPLSPYGTTKQQAEQVMADMSKSHGLRAISLRYFNAAGAEPKARVGEWHENETHLIPRILANAIQMKAVDVYGNDYPTPDGTCIRDYVHITDLASAHTSAMTRLLSKKDTSDSFEAFNLGSEQGFSVLEVIAAAEKVTGIKIQKTMKPRRSGDSSMLVADSTRAKEVLGYSHQYTNIETIISSAWTWQKKLEQIKKGGFKRA